jgi:hypothetical protein
MSLCVLRKTARDLRLLARKSPRQELGARLGGAIRRRVFAESEPGARADESVGGGSTGAPLLADDRYAGRAAAARVAR